jgi:hypothetical protein
MQQYAIIGDWERQGTSKRWLEWSSGDQDEITGWFKVSGRRIRMFSSDAAGDPSTRFAAGRISQPSLLQSLDAGEWGSNPGLAGGDPGVVDVWGDGINKLASLMVTNERVYDTLFGAMPMG